MPVKPETDAFTPAEIEAMLTDLERQIREGPTEADIKAEAEAEVADLCRFLDSL